jgi:hypothetical protein
MMRLVRAAGLAALLALAACFAPRSDDELKTPRSHDEWTGLVAELRAFQRRIGYAPTKNFRDFSGEKKDYPYCGHVSRFYLPYSYEDPAIKWYDVPSEEACLADAEGADVTFGTSEAVAERETPLTSAMLVAPLPRFLYVVLHEDCHEQYALPYGIEEPLCNAIAYRAMAAFAAERFKSMPAERRAIQRFVRAGVEHSRVTVASYEQLAVLYERHERSALPPEALLKERARIFRSMERRIAWPRGSMNNVWIANAMTYSRHSALIDRVFDALGGDLERTVRFFKHVDAVKPAPGEVVKRQRLANDTDLAFVRAYEAAIIETIERELRSVVPARGGNPGAV